MTKLGITARADAGGLSALLCEAVRHLRPDAILHVDLGPGSRGRPSDVGLLTPYAPEGKVWTALHVAGQRYTFGNETDMFFAEIAGGTLISAETCYDRRAYDMCRQYGIRLVVHAMPELLADVEVHGADDLWLPTSWMFDEVAARRERAGKSPPVIVPVPVAADRFDGRARRRERAEVFYADGGEAFHDRNGMMSTFEACWAVEKPCKLYVRGTPHPAERVWTRGKVTIEHLDPVEHYWETLPDDVDVAFQPRRYGGLSMGVQEAAALGVPTVMTDLPPNRDWTPPWMMVPTCGSYAVRMKGGYLPVYEVNPTDLARTWNALIDDPRLVGRASELALAWADSLSWDRHLARYNELLRGPDYT